MINHAGLQDDASTSGEVEEANNVAGEVTDEPRSDEGAYHNGDVRFERTEENALQLAVDSRSPSPQEHTKTHSVATALDGTRLKCTTCKGEQGVISVINHIISCTTLKLQLRLFDKFMY